MLLFADIHNSLDNIVPFGVSVDGTGYQMSGSCLHSMMDASQTSDVPFNLLGRVGFCYRCIVYVRTCVRAYVRTAIYAYVCCSTGVTSNV